MSTRQAVLRLDTGVRVTHKEFGDRAAMFSGGLNGDYVDDEWGSKTAHRIAWVTRLPGQAIATHASLRREEQKGLLRLGLSTEMTGISKRPARRRISTRIHSAAIDNGVRLMTRQQK